MPRSSGMETVVGNGRAARPPGAPPNPRRRIIKDVVTASRDPQMGVSDVTQLLTLTEESVMQNTMVAAKPP